MKEIVAWLALAAVVVFAASSRGQDQNSDRTTNTYTTKNEEHVTVERTTTTVRETTVVHVVKQNYKCAIVVENHSDKIDDKKTAALQDLMTGYATDRGFNIVSKEDVLGALTPGNDLDATLSNNTSALRLAQNLGVDYILVCTITSYGTDRQTYRDPSQDIDLINMKHQMRTTYRLLNIVDGGSEVAGVAVATITDRIDPRNGNMERENLVDDLLDAEATDMAEMLSHDAHAGKIAPQNQAPAEDVSFDVHATVANLNIPVVEHHGDGQYEVMGSTYHPEILNATVEVDGIVVGTTPGPLTAKPGLHKMRVRRDLFNDWTGMVNLHNGMKLDVALSMNDEGLREYAGLSRLFEHLRAHDVLTDAEAKEMEGKATELSHSAIRVDIGGNGHADMDVHDPGGDAIIHASGNGATSSTTRP